MSNQSQDLTYKWLVRVLGVVIFFVFTFWVTNVTASINELNEKTAKIDSLTTQISLLQKQTDRIESGQLEIIKLLK